MIGYVVQARSVQRATEAQTSLEHEVAEREKVEAKARKQLERGPAADGVIRHALRHGKCVSAMHRTHMTQ
jgi:hypothetical protein